MPTPFRSFTPAEFCRTASWSRLNDMLAGNGGCYGLYGPRGSGKTWLMAMAIAEAERREGLGLWFPCPAAYEPSEFLASLSDNLVSAVQRRFERGTLSMVVISQLKILLGGVIGVPLLVAVVAYTVHGLNSTVKGTVFSLLPGAVWLAVEIAAALLPAIVVGQIVWENRPEGRILREAKALRERVHFTASLKRGTEINVGAGGPVTGSLKRARERALDERPVTVASLVFDFRALAALVAAALRGPLVIGIDELDKLSDPEIARTLLRDIKGIFEIAGVCFLVSVSEEAHAALQLGSLREGGRNEFNSSFYAVIELPPLSSGETEELLSKRGLPVTHRQAQILCLLGEGNWREVIRLAEQTVAFLVDGEPRAGMWQAIALMVMEGETVALLREIAVTPTVTDAAKLEAWHALPRAAFKESGQFSAIAWKTIPEFWEHPIDSGWQIVQEPWRRLLVRMYVTGSVIRSLGNSANSGSDDDSMIADLRDVMIMASRSSRIARAMLVTRFGSELDGVYTPPPL